MPNYKPSLDQIFQAMSDSTRIGILNRLSESSASVTELAKPFDMALPSFMQHLNVLEKNYFVTSQKIGRTRIYSLRCTAFDIADEWLQERKSICSQRLNRLDGYLNLMKEEKND